MKPARQVVDAFSFDTWSRVQHLDFTLLGVIADGELVAIVYYCRAGFMTPASWPRRRLPRPPIVR